jgi:hypothetical protein
MEGGASRGQPERMTRSAAADLAAVTPATRDRYVDLLRVASLGTVIVGHWLMAVVVIGPGGSVTATNALALLPWLQPLTWLLQVMPVFFLVGGFSHATALASLERRGGTYADFVRSRAGRLLRPTAAFVAVWLVVALLVEVSGSDRGLLALATRLVAQPLWFVGVYLGVVAFAPLMLRWHRRHGAAVLAQLLLGVVVVDVARFAFEVPYVGFVNVALVWLFVHQLGFCYADGSLLRGGHRGAVALVVGGLGAVLLLVGYGPYPVSMVGMPGEKVSNMAPPSLALLGHAVWLAGLLLLLRAPALRWLQRPRIWTAVVAANGAAMTAFLWHLTALFLATAATLAAGLTQPEVGSLGWLLLRPLWIAVLAAVTVGLVASFRRADRPAPALVNPAGDERRRRVRNRIAAVGMALCVVGVLGLSAVGFGGPLSGRTAMLVFLPVTPLRSLGLLAAGAAMLASTARRDLPGTGLIASTFRITRTPG